MKKILSLVLVLVLCLTLFSGCGSDEIKTENDALNKKIVMTVGDIKYTQADYNFVYKLLYDNMSQYSTYYGDDWFNFEVEEGKTIGDFIKENTEMQLKQLAVSNIIAAEKGIKEDKVIKEKVAEQKKNIITNNYGSEQGYIDFLVSTRTTDRAINTYLTMYEIYNNLYVMMSKKGGEVYIEDKDVEEDFLTEYAEALRVKHILISTAEQTDAEGNPTPARSDADAQTIVKEVIAKLDAGEDFDKLIGEYDEDPGMESGGFYVFGAGEMVPEFEEASKNLEIGKYTKQGVKTDYGYHIIQRYPIDTTMDEFKQYKDSRMQEKMTTLINEKMEKTTVESEEKELDAYIKDWTDKLNEELAAQNTPAEDEVEPSTSEETEAEAEAE